jgi:hypothetical protein
VLRLASLCWRRGFYRYSATFPLISPIIHKSFLIIVVWTDLDGGYGDVLELALYNAALTGMSLDGKRFTYVNQLASSPSDPSQREEWLVALAAHQISLGSLATLGVACGQRNTIRSQKA